MRLLGKGRENRDGSVNESAAWEHKILHVL